ncbi:MAG TPA: SAM-dependent methyltransferase [Bacteroidetes bacterium]|nr:SAM-dependent methyltransferase [Bacteroidota bacterium]
MKTFWDERYSQKEYVYGTEPNEFFRDQLPLLEPKSILLPAEGEGRNAVYAATRGWNVHAFDQSIEGRKKALALAAMHNVNITYEIADVLTVQLPHNHFDAIGLFFAHFHAQQREQIHARFLSSLRSNGTIIFEVFSTKQIEYQQQYGSGGPQQKELLYTAGDVETLFVGCDLLLLEEKEIVLNEGEFHNGKASVVRCVARKR